ncbi:MAG TPA: hypothetical protein EYN67_11860 [Flavobacteriales bacterium]|nr:hypothetical protein [Flavobacteriales bacterium]
MTCQEATGDGFGLGGNPPASMRTKAGVRILSGNSLIGQTITKVSFYLKKSNTPTGNINLAVYNGGVDQSVGGSTLDATTITTSYVLYEFTMSRLIAENDDIVLEGGTVSDPNQVNLSQNTDATVYPTQISVDYSGSWAIYAGRNCYFCWDLSSPTALLPPPPAYVRI